VTEAGFGKELFFGSESCTEAASWIQALREAIGDDHVRLRYLSYVDNAAYITSLMLYVCARDVRSYL
jgi:hypothetical protein